MAKRTTEELAQQLADMKWGDSLSDLEMGAYEARALGRAFVALRQQLEAVKPEADEGWIEWRGGECPVDEGVWVGFKLSSGITVEANNPEDWEWHWFDTDSKIVAYRLVS